MDDKKTPLETALYTLRHTRAANVARKTGTAFGYESQSLLTGEETEAVLDALDHPALRLSPAEIETLRDLLSKVVILKQSPKPAT